MRNVSIEGLFSFLLVAFIVGFVIFTVLALVTAPVDKPKTNTEEVIPIQKDVVFFKLCDHVHNIGVWAYTIIDDTEDVGYGFAIPMSDATFELECYPVFDN